MLRRQRFLVRGGAAVGGRSTKGDGAGPAGTVVIMAKDPTSVPFKTRLAATVGDGAARDLYRTFILDELATVEAAGLEAMLSLHPPSAGEDFKAWLGASPRIVPQVGEDLGARIISSLSAAAGAREGFVVTISSDVPDLPPGHLREAIDLLSGTDAVLASSSDGGFHLIGVRRHAVTPDLLEGVPWSTGRAMSVVRERLVGRGLAVAEVTPWYDVDDGEDLEALRTRLEGGVSRATRTARALETLAEVGAEGPWLSVVVPVLHEEAAIAECVDHTLSTAGPGGVEVIVVDGDPGGGTLAVIGRQDVVCLTAERGRGTQMNAGAALARGEVLLFLHADSRLPDGAAGLIREALSSGDSDVGAFDVSYGEDGTVRRMMGKLGSTRARMRRMPFGDQGIFMTRQAFEELEGFPGVPIMEDVEMMLRVKRSGREPVFIDRPVTTSVRRFQRVGFWRTNARNMAMLWMHRFGLPPDKLALFYPPQSEERRRWERRPDARGSRGEPGPP